MKAFELGTGETIPDRLPTFVLVGYGLGSLGTGIFSTVPSVLLLFFLTETLSVPVAMGAVAVFIPKFLDVIIDPAVGILSDRTKSRMGRRRPFLLTGAILSGLSFLALFIVPTFAMPLTTAVYVTMAFFFSAAAYSVFAVPYIAMPAEMSDSSSERAHIVSIRMAFVFIGIFIGSAAAPALVAYAGSGRQGYAVMAIALGLISTSAMLIAYAAAGKVPMIHSEGTGLSLREQWRAVIGNKQFVRLLTVYVLLLTGVGATSAMLPYFVNYQLARPSQFVGAMFMAMLMAAVISLIVWMPYARVRGSRTSLMAAVTVLGIGYLSLFLSDSTTTTLILMAQMAIVGVGFSGIQVFPFALLTDVIRLDAEKCGEKREGLLTGIWTAAEKVGLAFGPLVAGTLLSLGGFMEGGIEKQPASAIIAIRIALSVLPLICGGVALWLLVMLPSLQSNTTIVRPKETAQ